MTISHLLISANQSRLPSATIFNSFLPQKGSGTGQGKVRALPAQSQPCVLCPPQPAILLLPPCDSTSSTVLGPLFFSSDSQTHVPSHGLLPESIPPLQMPQRAAPCMGTNRHSAPSFTNVLHFTLTTTLWGKHCYHFTGEEAMRT